MIYGNQWDRVLNWLVETGAKEQDEVYSNSSSWGNYSEDYSGTPQAAGSNPAWQANNIYDLAGNYFDWTQEAVSTYLRFVRGRCLRLFRFRLSSFWPRQQRRSRLFQQPRFLKASFICSSVS